MEIQCPHCDDGFIKVRTQGLPEIEEPCAICRPDAAEAAQAKLQRRLNKEVK